MRFSDSWDERLELRRRPDSIIAWLRALERDHPFVLTGMGSIGWRAASAPRFATRTRWPDASRRSVPTSWTREPKRSRRWPGSSCSRNDSTAGGTRWKGSQSSAWSWSSSSWDTSECPLCCAACREFAPAADRPDPDTWHAIVEQNVALARGLSSDERERCFGWCRYSWRTSISRDVGTRPHGGDEGSRSQRRRACAAPSRGPCYPTLRRCSCIPRIRSEARPVSRDRRDRATPARLIGESWGDGVVVISWTTRSAGHASRRRGQRRVARVRAPAGCGGRRQRRRADPAAEHTAHLGRRAVGGVRAVASGPPLMIGARRSTTTGRPTRPSSSRSRRDVLREPVQLEREHPALYAQLQQFYRQDPARRAPPPRPPGPAL